MVFVDEICTYTPFLRYRTTSYRYPDVKAAATRGRSKPKALRGVREIQEQVKRGLMSTKPPLNDHQLTGGLRPDPFGSLPVQTALPVIGDALDFCDAFWFRRRPQLQHVYTFFRAFIHEAMQKETLLLAMTTHVQSFHERVLQQKAPSISLLGRLNELFVRLRLLLDHPESSSDEAILLIYMIVNIERMLGTNPHETALHLAGMGQLITRKGGLDKLGLGGIVKQAVVSQKFFWLFATPSSCGIQEPAQLAFATTVSPKSLAYPTNPFGSTLDKKLALLPSHLWELAQLGYLCHGLIDIAFHFQVWIARAATSETVEANGYLVDSIYRNYGTLNHLLHILSFDYQQAKSDTTKPVPQGVILNRSSIQSAICLVLVLLSADIFYNSPIRIVAPQLSIRLEEITDTRLWLQDDGFDDLESAKRRQLEKACIAWALMVAAEARDDPARPCMASQRLMARVFKITENQDEIDGEAAWYAFYKAIMEQFMCPWFLVKEWRRCFMKYWNIINGKP